jgi:hypothetical protein
MATRLVIGENARENQPGQDHVRRVGEPVDSSVSYLCVHSI